MIDSDSLLYDLVDLSLEGEKQEERLRKQFDALVLKEALYTGSGVFYYFEITEEQRKFRIADKNDSQMDQKNHTVINNLNLINVVLDINADVLIHLENGLIANIEVWNKTGSDYPKAELLSYQLKRY